MCENFYLHEINKQLTEQTIRIAEKEIANVVSSTSNYYSFNTCN